MDSYSDFVSNEYDKYHEKLLDYKEDLACLREIEGNVSSLLHDVHQCIARIQNDYENLLTFCSQLELDMIKCNSNNRE